jgi:preprotein translocase subunit YajC
MKAKIDLRDYFKVGQTVKCNTFSGRIGQIYAVYKKSVRIKLKDCTLKIQTTDPQEFLDKKFIEIV